MTDVDPTRPLASRMSFAMIADLPPVRPAVRSMSAALSVDAIHRQTILECPHGDWQLQYDDPLTFRDYAETAAAVEAEIEAHLDDHTPLDWLRLWYDAETRVRVVELRLVAAGVRS